MVMSWVVTVLIGISLVSAAVTGAGPALAAATAEGAQKGIALAFSLAGSLCLWTGLGKLMEVCGITAMLAKLLKPILSRLFPSSAKDELLRGHLSNNICANILGLGNAATPMGIAAARRLAAGKGGIASDELCRLVVLNTASIQLIPATVAALRAANGCAAPFDILPAVWLTSFASAALGLSMAWGLGRVWKDA